jgi:asparagine synthase (glutamine-hydrolysing)
VCGIAGFTGLGDSRLLRAMSGALRHRGPDGEAFASVPSREPARVHFAHRRLVILDREGGGQPMATADGRWLITYNGEIYNHAELRDELAGGGAMFRTRSDTEVLLAALARWGEDALGRLDGMFAFAAFDGVERRLLLAVDRFGQKPLLWSLLPDGRLAFASELQALRAHPDLRERWDVLSLCRMLAFNAPPAPHSIVEGVQRLDAGTLLAARVGPDGTLASATVRRWWRPPFAVTPARPPDAEFIEALRGSVRRHLVADVPVGVLLSGGVDSTVVAALAAEDRSVATLSMGFSDSDYDEAPAARHTAQVLGTRHHEFQLGSWRAAETLDSVMQHLDEPLADAGCLPAWQLYRAARQQVTVAVGGDGGDELLEGYPTFRALELTRRLGPVAGWAAPLLRPVAARLPVSESYYPLGFQARRFVAGMEAEPWFRLQAYLGGCGPALLWELLQPEVLSAAGLDGPTAERAARLYEPAFPADLRAQSPNLRHPDLAVWLHLRSFLAGEVLRKVDRMSMAHGLEVRAPMLGSPFAELCLAAHTRVRRRGRTGKRPLRRWLASSPLAAAARRGKKGFAVPVAGWLRRELRDPAEQVFTEPSSPLREWCRPEPLRRLWTSHLRGGQDARKELWALLTLGLWMRHHAASRKAEPNTLTAAAHA